MIVAMDGPAGTGKGTICRMIAERLGFVYVDTGAMYRAITLKMLRNQIKENDFEKIEEMLKMTKIDFEGSVETSVKGTQKVLLDGEDVTSQIRMPEVNDHVSQYSAIKIIRDKMVELQRKIAEGKDVVMEGRDITTVVFPNADVKIYLTASLEERAKRRYQEFVKKGIQITYEETFQNIKERDDIDIQKEFGALKIAEDAIVVDTTDLTIEEVYEKMEKMIEEKR